MSGFSDTLQGPGANWNLKSMASQSLLQHVKYQIPGVTSPMFYLGTLFSVFAWHVEDNYLASINYMHRGSCKTWYGVPASHAYEMEQLVHQKLCAKHLDQSRVDHLASKNIVVHPGLLRQHGIPVYRVNQQPGEFVVTFPQAFHSGFSHGPTQAEATNYAPRGWLPFAVVSVKRSRHNRKESVIDVDALIAITAGLSGQPNAGVERSFEDLGICIDALCEERTLRSALHASKVHQLHGDALNVQQRWACSICKHICHFSVMFRQEAPDEIFCLRHSPSELGAKGGDLVCYVRYHDKELGDAIRELRLQQRNAKRSNSMLREGGSGLCNPCSQADPLLKVPPPALPKASNRWESGSTTPERMREPKADTAGERPQKRARVKADIDPTETERKPLVNEIDQDSAQLGSYRDSDLGLQPKVPFRFVATKSQGSVYIFVRRFRSTSLAQRPLSFASSPSKVMYVKDCITTDSKNTDR